MKDDYPFWLEFRTGLVVVSKYTAGILVFAIFGIGALWLYQTQPWFETIVHWLMVFLICAVLLVLAVAGICNAGEAELNKRKQI